MTKDEILVLAGECGIKFKPLPRDLYCEIWSEQLESFYHAACKPLEDKIEQLKTVPMKYRRMAFNAQLQNENAELLRQLASAQLDNDQLRAELSALKADNATAPQPEPNHNWCAGCSPDNCSGCGAEPVDSEPAMWVMKHIRSGDLAQAKPNQKALHPRMWSQAHLYTTPQPDRVAELEAALKVARDGIDEFLVANDPTEFGCACDLSVGYLCGPCRADEQQEPLKIALAKINEVLHD